MVRLHRVYGAENEREVIDYGLQVAEEAGQR
jgi:hypothetical protein